MREAAAVREAAAAIVCEAAASVVRAAAAPAVCVIAVVVCSTVHALFAAVVAVGVAAVYVCAAADAAYSAAAAAVRVTAVPVCSIATVVAACAVRDSVCSAEHGAVVGVVVCWTGVAWAKAGEVHVTSVVVSALVDVCAVAFSVPAVSRDRIPLAIWSLQDCSNMF